MTDLTEEALNPDAGCYSSPAHYAAHLEGLCQELAGEVRGLRGLLREWLANEFVWNSRLIERTNEALGEKA